MILRIRGAHRIFGIVCGVWLLGSVVLPAWGMLDNPFSLLVLLPVLLLVGPAVPVGALLLGIKRFRKGRYRSGLGWLTILAASILLCFHGRSLGETLRFQWNKPSYDRVVADARAGRCAKADQKHWNVDIDAVDCSDPVTVIFVWDGFLSMWNGVIYDAGDQIAKTSRDRSPAWKNRAIGHLLSCSGTSRSLGGHYYLAGGNYTSGTDECG